jgi:1-acyl-sn-glycerol-3-phosphate acyltransferase
MKPFDYSTVRQYKFSIIMKPIFKFLSVLVFRVKTVGKENVPKEGGLILASNHISASDPGYIYVNLKRPVHNMGKQELFKNPLFGWVNIHLNGFPVARGAADKRAVEYAIEVIRQGGILGIFPEGTRSKDYTPQQAKPGVALIAREAKAGVVPVSIYTEDRAKPFTKTTVRFGKLIPYEALGFGSGVKSEELKAASNLIMDEIKKLWALGHSK